MVRLLASLLSVVSLVALLGCGGDDTNEAQSQLPSLDNLEGEISYEIFTPTEELPLIDQSCWDWFPEGDGLVWGLTTKEGEPLGEVVFVFEEVFAGRAVITNAGDIMPGQVAGVRSGNSVQPIFQAIEINPDRGVLAAFVGNIGGTC